ncbi:MAG: hypothetical protein P4M04_09400, partial [Acidobacteriota bacterium]|nr:hypothetical protein [Acidobacteriota bacterium]
CRLALGPHRFSPVFRLFANHYREILDQQSSQIIRFYRGFTGFSGTTELVLWHLRYPTHSPEKRRMDGARSWYKINRSETWHWLGQKGLVFEAKTGFFGHFQGANLTMREDLEAKSFQQALIPNGLKIICKVFEGNLHPLLEGGGGRVLRGYKPGTCLTFLPGHS